MVSFRKVERMVGNHDLYHLRIAGVKPIAHPGNLIFIDTPSLDSQRPRRIDTHHRNLVVVIERLEIVSYIALVFAKWLQEAREDIMQRNVMIAWDDDLRFRQVIQKRACFFKLL